MPSNPCRSSRRAPCRCPWPAPRHRRSPPQPGRRPSRERRRRRSQPDPRPEVVVVDDLADVHRDPIARIRGERPSIDFARSVDGAGMKSIRSSAYRRPYRPSPLFRRCPSGLLTLPSFTMSSNSVCAGDVRSEGWRRGGRVRQRRGRAVRRGYDRPGVRERIAVGVGRTGAVQLRRLADLHTLVAACIRDGRLVCRSNDNRIGRAVGCAIVDDQLRNIHSREIYHEARGNGRSGWSAWPCCPAGREVKDHE